MRVFGVRALRPGPGRQLDVLGHASGRRRPGSPRASSRRPAGRCDGCAGRPGSSPWKAIAPDTRRDEAHDRCGKSWSCRRRCGRPGRPARRRHRERDAAQDAARLDVDDELSIEHRSLMPAPARPCRPRLPTIAAMISGSAKKSRRRPVGEHLAALQRDDAARVSRRPGPCRARPG